jgi:hypothetical protein
MLYYSRKEMVSYTCDRLKQLADSIYAVYPQKYKDIILGMAKTSELGIEKQIVLNALEFFPKIDNFVPHCSGIGVWGDYTSGGPLIFGRNNDDDTLYKAFGGYTVVAISHRMRFRSVRCCLPSEIISFPGLCLIVEEEAPTSTHPPAPYKNFVSGENKESDMLILYPDR